MPKLTRAGNLQVNLTLSPRTYKLLQRFAATKKSYGRLIGDALMLYVQAQERDELRERLERLELTLAATQEEASER